MPATAELENMLRILPGVLGVRVSMPQGNLEAIHVLVGSERHPKRVVRDIETVLAAHADIRVDRRCISVAQLNNEQSHESDRLVLDTVQMKMQGDRADIVIELIHRGERYTGQSTGPNLPRQRLRTVGLATLQAVARATQQEFEFALDDITAVEIGEQQRAVIALVSALSLQQPGGLFIGCAYIRRDEVEAAARATLAALNRKLEIYLEPSPRVEHF